MPQATGDGGGGGGGRVVEWEAEVPVPPVPNMNFATFMLNRMAEHQPDHPALVSHCYWTEYGRGAVSM